MIKHFIWVGLASTLSLGAFAQAPQRADKGTFIPRKPGFYENSILRGIEDYNKQAEAPKPPARSFKVDLTGMDLPKSPSEFTTAWCAKPISQGSTGTCWCFSTTSNIESEIKRQTGQEVKLSEAYTVYWEYVEKAREFVKTRGKSYFSEGSQAPAVIRMMEQYGAVPEDQYTGTLPGQTYLNHQALFAEMEAYMQGVKARSAWNEAEVLSTIKSMLNHYMGVPPTQVALGKKSMSPKEYMSKVLKFTPTDLVNVYSLMNEPYYTMAEYDVPDNWWNGREYYNTPLDEWMTLLKRAAKEGYTFTIAGDVSESGLVTEQQVAIVPTFDIPSEYINESARMLRYANGSTTDDHGMHVVGYKIAKDGKWWFLVKDSSAGSRNSGSNAGYYYFHEDYMKLKMLYFTVHKDAVKDLLSKFEKTASVN